MNRSLLAAANRYTRERTTPEKPAFQRSNLPGLLNGTVECTTSGVYRDTLWTHNGKQYTIWINRSMRAVVGQRTLPDGEWSTFSLSNATGDPFGNVNPDHCAYSVGVDANGFIHIAGNMHADPLKYAVSDNPEDISSFTSGTMVGTEESFVTYPTFSKLHDGTLLFWYRDGGSGLGDLMLNSYDTATGTWSRVAKVIDGKSDSLSPYWHHPVVDRRTGGLHLFWTWRDASGSAATSHDLSYAKSTDGGATWEKADGTALTLPLRKATVEVVEDTALSGSGLLNGGGADADIYGRPHVVYMFFDGSGFTQYKHAYWDGSAWQKAFITDFASTMDISGSTVDWSITNASVFTTAEGGVYIVYRNNMEHRGSIRLMDITPEREGADVELIPFESGVSHFPFDSQALYDRDELHLLMSSVEDTDLSVDTLVWDNQEAFVLTLDLDSIQEVIRGTAKWHEPKLRAPLIFAGSPTASEIARVMAPVDCMLRNVEPGTARVVTAATAATAFVVQRRSGSTVEPIGSLEFAAAATTGVISIVEPTEFAAGDWLELVAPGTPDSTLADLTWTVELLASDWEAPSTVVLPVTDTFTGVDGTDLLDHDMDAGPGWFVPAGSFTISGNQITGGVAGDNIALVDVRETSYTVTASTYRGTAVVVRCAGKANLWMVGLNLGSQELEIVERVNGVDTARASQAAAIVDSTLYDVVVTVTPDSISATFEAGAALVHNSTRLNAEKTVGVRHSNTGLLTDSFSATT